MFCNTCGKEIDNSVKFCSHCGHSTSMQISSAFDEDMYIRIAEHMISGFNYYPNWYPELDIIEGIDYKQCDAFNPMYRIDVLEKEIINVLMEKTQYRLDKSEFDIILKKTIEPKKEIMMRNIGNYLEQSFMEDMKNSTCHYKDFFKFRNDELSVYFYARAMTVIYNQLADVEGLLKARTIISLWDKWTCERPEYFTEGMSFNSSGYILKMNQFSLEKKLHDNLILFIDKRVIEINPNAEKVIDKIKSEKEKFEKGIKSKNRKTAITKTILILLAPVLMYLYSTRVYGFSEFHPTLVFVVGLILFILVTISTIKNKNIIVCLILYAISIALFYPLCWLTTAVIKVAVVVLVGIIIGMVLLFKGDRTDII